MDCLLSDASDLVCAAAVAEIVEAPDHPSSQLDLEPSSEQEAAVAIVVVVAAVADNVHVPVEASHSLSLDVG